MHTVWWHLIRLIVAAHFHVASSHVAEIDYWAHPADDPTYVWEYNRRTDCSYWTWGRYDVCLTG